MYPRKIKGANVLYGQPRDEASPRPRFSHQQDQECYGSSQDPRILGLHNQYPDHENFTAAVEGKQIATENQTTGEEYHEVMPMDSLVTGQDHCCNPGHIRSTFTYSPHSEGPGEEFATQSPPMGSQLWVDYQSNARDTMVETQSSAEEWITNTSTTAVEYGVDDSRGCIGHGLGGSQLTDQQSRFLDSQGKTTINKRTRANSDLLCFASPCKRLKGYRYQSLHRQHDRSKVRNQVRRHGFHDTTRFGSKNPRPLQPAPPEDSIPSCGRRKEHSGRQPQPVRTTNARTSDPETFLQQAETPVGKEMDDRCLRSSAQSSTTSVLEPTERSICEPGRCVPTGLAEGRPLHVPPVETHSTGLAEIDLGQNNGSDTGDPPVDDAILVPNAVEDATFEQTNNMGSPSVDTNRLAIICKKRKELGMTDALISHLTKATRDSTTKTYNANWQKYVDWCKTNEENPEAYNTKQVLSFLHQFAHLSPSTLNG